MNNNIKLCRIKSRLLAQILLLDQGRSIKRKLDTGVEVYNNKVKKKQRYATNKKPNMYINIFNKKKTVFWFLILIFVIINSVQVDVFYLNHYCIIVKIQVITCSKKIWILLMFLYFEGLPKLKKAIAGIVVSIFVKCPCCNTCFLSA